MLMQSLCKTLKNAPEKPQDNNSKSNGINNNEAPLVSQGNDANDLLITYCWFHDITSNIFNNSKSCECQKEGHKLNATYQNHMEGCTEHFKSSRKLIRGSMAGSNNNTIKETKLPLLQKLFLFALTWTNLKIDIGSTHYFYEIGSTNLPQQPIQLQSSRTGNCTQQSIHGILCNHTSSNSFFITICYKV